MLVREKQVGWAEVGFTLSELYLGGVDKSKVSGDLTYTAVTTPGYWQIKFGGVKMAGGSGNGTSSNDTRAVNKRDATDAIVDTDTTLLYGDSATVKGMYKKKHERPRTVTIEGKDFPI